MAQTNGMTGTTLTRELLRRISDASLAVLHARATADGSAALLRLIEAERRLRRIQAAQRFRLGRVLATPGALRALDAAGDVPFTYLARHRRGDWGDVCPEDAAANDAALRDGARVLSAYTLSTGERIWLITEWDRSATTILLPSEY